MIPEIKTDLPGPESKRLYRLSEEYEPRSIKRQFPIVWKKACGVTIEDVDGNRFLDFTSAVLIANIGHSHPRLITALKEQLDECLHSYNFLNEWRLKLTEKIVNITPPNLNRVFFVTTGAEGVELAINTVKFATEKFEVLSFWGGFHGKSYGTLSVGGKTGNRSGFGPTMPGVLHTPYPYCYRCPLGKEHTNCGTACFDFIGRMLEAEGTSNLACVVIEPFQGSSGQIEPPIEFMQKLSQWCNDNNIILIVDEVQASFGRTGKWFAFEHFGIQPNIVVAGKGISSGIPLTAIIGEDKILDNVKPGYLSSTHGGNPLAARAAFLTIDIINEEGLLDNAADVGKFMLERFIKLKEDLEILGDVRGKGLMIGLEIVESKSGKKPSPYLAKKIVNAAIKRGLLLIQPIGFYGNVIRISPPLCLRKDEAEIGIDILTKSFKEVL